MWHTFTINNKYIVFCDIEYPCSFFWCRILLSCEIIVSQPIIVKIPYARIASCDYLKSCASLKRYSIHSSITDNFLYQSNCFSCVSLIQKQYGVNYVHLQNWVKQANLSELYFSGKNSPDGVVPSYFSQNTIESCLPLHILILSSWIHDWV